MSTSYSEKIPFRCTNDCVQTGCPGHVLRIIYHNTSDTLSIERDGKVWWTLDDGMLQAIIEAAKTDPRW